MHPEQRTNFYSTTSAESHGEYDDDNEGFETPNRERKRIRRRSRQQYMTVGDGTGNDRRVTVPSDIKSKPKPKQTETQHVHSGDNYRRQQRNGRSRKQPLLVGKCMSSTYVAAAKPFKHVLCIDNVSLLIGVKELIEFVTSLGVRVISCYEVKARMSNWQRKHYTLPDHRTFRLCINKMDSDLLLNPDDWPADIVISRWHFKNIIAETAEDIAETADAAGAGAVDLTAAAAASEIFTDRRPLLQTTAATAAVAATTAIAGQSLTDMIGTIEPVSDWAETPDLNSLASHDMQISQHDDDLSTMPFNNSNADNTIVYKDSEEHTASTPIKSN